MDDTPLGAIRSLTKAWMNKDAEGMSRRLTDDIVEIGPAFPEALCGKKHFFRRYRKYLTGQRRVVSYRILHPRTLPLSRSIIQVHFRYTMRVEDSGAIEDSRGKESMVVVRSRTRWRVRFIHWHQDLP